MGLPLRDVDVVVLAVMCVFFFQAEDGIRDLIVTGVQTCALPISPTAPGEPRKAVPGGGRVGGMPLHEDDHPRKAARLAPGREIRGHRARGNRAARPASHRTDAGDWLTPWAWRRCAGRWPRTALVTT